MNSLESIQSFLEPKEMAISGVSRNPKKFGRVVYDHLLERGYKLYPVNPNIDQLDGAPCYKDIASLPDNVDRLYVVTSREQTPKVIEEAAAKGIKNVWIQQRSENDESIRLAEQHDINLIYKECMFKFADPVTGPHAFHRFINKVFGSYPK